MKNPPPVEIDPEVLSTLTTKIMGTGISIYDAQQLQRVYRTQIVKAMLTASFSSVFPARYLEDIQAFIKEAASEGFDHVVISLLTDHKGIGSFLYPLSVTAMGIVLEQAEAYYVPKKPADRVLPEDMVEYPHLAIDVGASSQA